jgi:hypothetical protein
MVIINTNAAEVSIQAVSPLSIFGAGAAAGGAAGAGAGASTFGGSPIPEGGVSSAAKARFASPLPPASIAARKSIRSLLGRAISEFLFLIEKYDGMPGIFTMSILHPGNTV